MTLAAINAAVAAVLAFLVQAVPSLQSRSLRRSYVAQASEESRALVPTAGTILDQVVGRDELCKELMADLHGRRTRPHVLVGGVGTGKTAVLVRLTEFLADQGAVPVPIRLRDSGPELDFENLARDRFLSEVDQYVLHAAEGETTWRRLRREGKVVVLADGLEEAPVGSSAELERDNIIRAAIRKAHQQRLPLVIASLPHDPLRATEAAIQVLEPLSYEAALAYVGSDGTRENDSRLAWIVETADVVEAPLYLQITRELHAKGLLEPFTRPGRGDWWASMRGADRATLRLGLLQAWERALIGGYLYEDVPLNRAERQAAVEHASALACTGFRHDRRDVELDDVGDRIAAEVQRRLAKIDEEAGRHPGVGSVDVRLAAAWAAQLELVELRENSVRFPDSLMQAFLGSRLLDAALQDPGYRQEALRYPQPGRKFLIALVLRSRAARQAGSPRRDPGRRPSRTELRLADLLPQAAAGRDDNKVLDMYAAALEIDCVADEPAHTAIAEQIRNQWSQIRTYDPRSLEEGKLALVRRFGEAARTIDARRRSGEQFAAEPAYQQLYAIGCRERSYPVQLATALEIGAGGDAAYRALRPVLAAPCQACAAERAGEDGSGSPPFLRPSGDSDSWPAWIMSAWLAPMLAGSASAVAVGRAHLGGPARDDLAQWLRHAGPGLRRRPGEEELPISLEIALAQGFKHAANRRRSAHPDVSWEAPRYLADQALEMLAGNRFWFSQLTLIQALCLLDMSDHPEPASDRHGPQPETIVQRWLDAADRERPDRRRRAGMPAGPHPFVREAAELAVLALKTGRPQRYCWIDESAVVDQVGSRNTGMETVQRNRRLWIPPSAGWTGLDGRAQRLVADVLLLLNLADRGDQPSERERRLNWSNHSDLPPCITRYRETLNPGRTVGTAASSPPGTNCVDWCAFRLCPYPPKGAQPSRVEMSEAFCRRQYELVSQRSLIRHTAAPWQTMRSAQLKGFWLEMAARAGGWRRRAAILSVRRR
jgi:hypothetical protein